LKIKIDKILGKARELDEQIEVDGGFSNSVYLSAQSIDGGNA